MYLWPLHVVHPFYYKKLGTCPGCKSTDIKWNGWTATGAQGLHGVKSEERAIGFQLICLECEERCKSE